MRSVYLGTRRPNDVVVVITTEIMYLNSLAISMADILLPYMTGYLSQYRGFDSEESRAALYQLFTQEGVYLNFKAQAQLLMDITKIWAEFPDQTTVTDEVLDKVARTLETAEEFYMIWGSATEPRYLVWLRSLQEWRRQKALA